MARRTMEPVLSKWTEVAPGAWGPRGSTPMSAIAPFGPVSITYDSHGMAEAQFEVDPRLQHPMLRGGMYAQIMDSGIPIGVGTVVEPSTDGLVTIVGAWNDAKTATTLDAVGAPTGNPSSAVDAAQARGEIRFGRADDSLALGDWAEPSTTLMLADLLDDSAMSVAKTPWVDGYGVVRFEADPTKPRWTVPHAVAGRGLAPAEDSFYTHLVGRYMTLTPGVMDTELVGDDDAAIAMGRRRVGHVDLEPLGPIDKPRAHAEMMGIFALAGARMGWAEGMTLSTGQITSPGGEPAPLSLLRSRQMIRLEGVIDTSRPSRLEANLEVVMGQVKYTDGADVVSWSPVQKAPRSTHEVLAVAVA